MQTHEKIICLNGKGLKTVNWGYSFFIPKNNLFSLEWFDVEKEVVTLLVNKVNIATPCACKNVKMILFYENSRLIGHCHCCTLLGVVAFFFVFIEYQNFRVKPVFKEPKRPLNNFFLVSTFDS
jgi:hypothetical protein